MAVPVTADGIFLRKGSRHGDRNFSEKDQGHPKGSGRYHQKGKAGSPLLTGRGFRREEFLGGLEWTEGRDSVQGLSHEGAEVSLIARAKDVGLGGNRLRQDGMIFFREKVPAFLRDRVWDSSREAADDLPEGCPIFFMGGGLLAQIPFRLGQRMRAGDQLVTRGPEVVQKHPDRAGFFRGGKEDVGVEVNPHQG